MGEDRAVIWLKAIPIRFWVCAGVALLIGGLLWKDHYNVKRLNATRTELRTAKASLETERENRRKSDASANRYAKRINALRAPRSPAPVLMCKLPKLPSPSTAPSGTDAAGEQHDSGVLEDVDISARLELSFLACEANLIKLEELQRWVRER
jgi:hypothetical protein